MVVHAIHILSLIMLTNLNSDSCPAFLRYKCISNDGRIYINFFWASCLNDCCSTSGYCVFLGASHICCSSKKQHTVSQSSIGAEYKSVANATYELI